MKNILAVIRHDVRAIRGSVMAAVVVFGLLIIPLMFTVFNVIASWDPFSNTGNLKIAVASEDRGHETDLTPAPINLGDQVLSQLSVNDQIDWTITSTDDALEGTKSGEYYAAIVLPPTFSTDMLTFYIAGTEPTKLKVYTNEKKNALGPIITNQAASGAISQINESFTKVVSNVGLGVVTSLNDFLNQDDTKAALDRVTARIDGVQRQLHSVSRSVDSLGGLVDSTIPLVDSANRIIGSAEQQFGDSSLGSDNSDGASIGDTLSNGANSLSAALETTMNSYSVVDDRIDELFNNADSTTESMSASASTMAKRVGQQVDLYKELRNQLESGVAPVLPPPAKPGYDSAVRKLDDAIQRSADLRDTLNQTAQDIRSGKESAQASRGKIQAAVQKAKDAVDQAKSSYSSSGFRSLE